MIKGLMFWTVVLSISMTVLVWPPHKMLTATISASEPGASPHGPALDDPARPGPALDEAAAGAMPTAPPRASITQGRHFVAAVNKAPDHRPGAPNRLLRLSRQIQALNAELAAARQDVMVQQRLLADRKRESARADRSGGPGGTKLAALVKPLAPVKRPAAGKPQVAVKPQAAATPKTAAIRKTARPQPKTARPNARKSPALITAAAANNGRRHVEIHTGTIVPSLQAAARVKAAGTSNAQSQARRKPSRSKPTGRQFLKSALADDTYWEQLVARSARAARTRKTWRDFLVASKPPAQAKLAVVPHGTGSIGQASFPSRQARLAPAPQPFQPPPRIVAPPPPAPRPVLSRRELVLALQKKLQDIGCTPGPLDGKWGRKGQDAMERAYDSVGIGLDSAVASGAALKALSALRGRICLRSCNKGEILQRGSCVQKPTPEVVAEPTAPPAVRRRPQQANSAPAPEPPPESGASWTRDVFGINN